MQGFRECGFGHATVAHLILKAVDDLLGVRGIPAEFAKDQQGRLFNATAQHLFAKPGSRFSSAQGFQQRDSGGQSL